MSRISDVLEKGLTPEQRRVHDMILSGPRGTVEGPLRVWLHSPEFAARAQELGAFCRYGTSLPPRLSELAILLTGAHWRAGFEWHVHAPIAVQAGLPADAVEAIRRGETPELTGAKEAVVFAFTRELLQTRQVTEATFARAREHLGERALVELVGLLGYYALISMTIIAFGVPVSTGAPEPFETRV